MSLRRAHVTCIFDVENAIFTEQIPLVGSALVRAIQDLSGITVTTKELAAQRSDKSGRRNIIKHIILVPAGVDAEETLLNGSDVGTALIDPEFTAEVSRIIKELHGQDSAILECDAAVSTALVEQAQGLIIEAPEPSPILELDFRFKRTNGFDTFDVIPTVDMLDTKVGQINYTQTPFISSFEGVKITEIFNSFRGPGGISDPLIGRWELTSTEVLGPGPPTASTFFATVNSETQDITLKQDTADIGILAARGTIISPTVLTHRVDLIDLSTTDILRISSSLGDVPNNTSKILGFRDGNTSFKTIDSSSASLKITNTTGSTILKGTPLGIFVLRKSTIEEIF